MAKGRIVSSARKRPGPEHYSLQSVWSGLGNELKLHSTVALPDQQCKYYWELDTNANFPTLD